MRKSRILAVILVALTALSPSISFGGATAVVAPGLRFSSSNPVVPYVIFGCAGTLIFTAIIANWQQKRQLTAVEAATCGFLFWFTQPPRGR